MCSAALRNGGRKACSISSREYRLAWPLTFIAPMTRPPRSTMGTATDCRPGSSSCTTQA
ncbi:Uncharacterised protein [Bordetella pertussis]|nr:Uncharacterised protein [Bordetella pertussis]CFT89673.1 Uncharacterised protein [Bordetella pertussis]